MLLRLTPDQVAYAWDGLKEPIRQTLLPHLSVTDEALNNILAGITQGVSQVWVLTDEVDGKNRVYAVGVTTFSVEGATGDKNLLIYSLYGFRFVPEKLWMEGLEGLKRFAKANGCGKLIAFTVVDRIVTIARSLGANTNVRQIIWEV